MIGLVFMLGCQNNWNTTPPPKVYPVQGKVVLANSEVVRGGVVTFHPKDPGGAEALGEINNDGTFKLTTMSKNDGALPGQYTVSVNPYSNQTGRPVAKDAERIPRKFWAKSTSSLSFEVKSQENNFTIQVK